MLISHSRMFELKTSPSSRAMFLGPRRNAISADCRLLIMKEMCASLVCLMTVASSLSITEYPSLCTEFGRFSTSIALSSDTPTLFLSKTWAYAAMNVPGTNSRCGFTGVRRGAHSFTDSSIAACSILCSARSFGSLDMVVDLVIAAEARVLEREIGIAFWVLAGTAAVFFERPDVTFTFFVAVSRVLVTRSFLAGVAAGLDFLAALFFAMSCLCVVILAL